MEKHSFRKGVNTLIGRGMSRHQAVRQMRYYAATNEKGIDLTPKAAFYLICVILFAVVGRSDLSQFFTNLFAGALIGIVTSEAAGSIVERFGGSVLKKYSLTVHVWKFNFSFSVFAIVTALVEFWLFS